MPQVCAGLTQAVEELRPPGWEDSLQSENPLRPFSLKHARQQASLVAHMQRRGLIPSRNGSCVPTEQRPPTPKATSSDACCTTVEGQASVSDPAARSGDAGDSAAQQPAGSTATQGDRTVYIEFGAGTGYLSAMLAECTGARRLVLLDRGSFRMKADRSPLLRPCPPGIGALSA